MLRVNTIAFAAAATFFIANFAFDANAAQIQLTDGGVNVNAGSMGDFTLSYPSINRSGKESKFISKQHDGNRTVLKYDNGASITVDLKNGKDVELSYANMGAGVESVRMEMLMDFNFSEGGHWKIDKAEGAFPKDKPAKPFLFQGNAQLFELTSFEGKQLKFHLPEHSWHQLQDNREWGWKVFCWWYSVPYIADHKTETIGIEYGAAPGGEKKVIVVDALGQDAQSDFPEKVKSADDVKAGMAAEDSWYASLTPPVRDEFGGLPDSGAKFGLKKTGFFHVEKKGDRWLLADPDGNAFFHLGVCSFHPMEDYTYVKGRESIYAWLPPYDGEFKGAYHPDNYWSRDTISFYIANVIRKYGKYDVDEWQTRMIGRVRKFGFNSGGAFSSFKKEVRDAAKLPYVEHLWCTEGGDPAIVGVPGVGQTLDPFDEANAANLEKRFVSLEKSANDPLIIGFFLSNEPNQEDLPRVVAGLTGKSACKRHLIAMLTEKYKTVEAFNQAWDVKFATFEAATDAGLAIKTHAASEDMKAYTAEFFNAYYKLIADTFHKHDPNHMLIGNRWQPQTANGVELCNAAGKYMDVISVNYYTYGIDTDYLNRVQQNCGGKPMFLSEFYWPSPKESGLPGGGKDVATMQQRGLAYRNYVEQAAALKYVVGIEWFTLLDQARTGRFFSKYNGENGNTGLFSVTDRPWKATVNEMMKTNYDIYAVEMGERAPFEFDNPQFKTGSGGHKSIGAPRTPGAIKLDGKMTGWPGVPPEGISSKRIVEGLPGQLEAQFRLCWDEKNLYIKVDVTDPTPMKNSQNGANQWMGDGIELFIGGENLAQPGSLQFGDHQILIGAKEKSVAWVVKATEQPLCETAVFPGIDGKSYVLEAAIPWQALNIKPADGREFLFDLAVDDSENGESRTRQIMWNGTAKNSGDRTNWGRAKLGQ